MIVSVRFAKYILISHFYSYGKFLLKNGKFNEAVERLKSSRDVFIEVRGRYDPEYVNILNDLAVASLHVRTENILLIEDQFRN